MSEIKKSKRGGPRKGAGRKSKAAKAAVLVEAGVLTAPAEADPYGDKAWLDAKREPAKSLDEQNAEEAARRAAMEAVAAETVASVIGAKRGRPPEYKPEYAAQAEKLCRLGATDRELADFFEVEASTIWRWAHRYDAFCSALKAGKDACDDRVERSLYHRAIGYSHDAVKIFMPAGAKAPVYADYVEHVPPDVAAASLWLRNRRGEAWRDKQEHVHRFKPEHMTDDDLAAIAARGSEGAAETPPNPSKLN